MGLQSTPLPPTGPIRLQPPGPYPAGLGPAQYQQLSPIDSSIGHQQRYVAPNSVYSVAGGPSIPQIQLHPAAAVKREMLTTSVFTFPPDSVEARLLGPELKRKKLIARDLGNLFNMFYSRFS